MPKNSTSTQNILASLSQNLGFLGIGLGGILLRFFYTLRTPYGVRAYDWDGHLEYITYVLDHWSMPPAHDGWQFYQPPLYYFLSAVIGFPAKFFGLSKGALIAILQAESFVLSSVAFLAGLWLGRMLFPSHKTRVELHLFSGLLAVYPGFVFFSSRISNDTLLLALGYLFFSLLYHWWQTGRKGAWIGASVLLAAALLTKSNALAWIPLLFGVLALRPGMQLRRALSLAAGGLYIITLLSGWLYAERFLWEDQRHLVGNIASNNGALRIQTIAPENFFTFRPAEVLRHPYNSSWEDTYGRRFFWEHLFKSSIVGEWNFGKPFHDISRVIFAVLMLCVVSAFVELTADLWSSPRAHAPLWLLGFFLISSMMALVIHEPIGGFQDFRYVPLLLIPGLFYALRAFSLASTIIRQAGYQLFSILLVLCTLLVLRLLLS